MSSSDEFPPTPIPVLTPELVTSLRDRTQDVLAYLVQTNSISTYFKESDILSDFRNALKDREDTKGDALFQTFHDKVGLSVYDNYLPFVSRFFEKPCNKSSIENMMAPGLPYFIAHSSGTSSGITKHFPKYRHPEHMSMSTNTVMQVSNPSSKDGGKNCIVYSLTYYRVVECLNDGGDIERRIPVYIMSSGTVRMYNDMDIERDELYQTIRVPNNTSPLAVSYIPNYKSLLFMHALFALQDPQLGLINTMFSTTFRDFCHTIKDNWEKLVECIETGTIPDLEAVENLKEKLAKFLPPSPERAAELRKIGRALESPGWFKKIWPGLRAIIAIPSGPFQTVVPEIRHYIGPDVELRTLGITCSEAFLALAYDPRDPNLYKVVGSDDVVEFLPIESPEESKYLTQTWNVEVGRKYEVVLTTRDGFWRYRLGDIIEVVGFDPRDGQPIIHYLQRRNLNIRVANEIISEQELREALLSTTESLGIVSEFCVSADYRESTPRYAYFVEPQGALGPSPASAPSQIHTYFQQHDINYLRESNSKKIGVPVIRVLKQGTFSEFRDWKIRTTKMASGQIKVPSVVYDEQLRNWLAERVVEEY